MLYPRLMKKIFILIIGFWALLLHAEESVILIDGPETDLTVADIQKAILSMDEEAKASLLVDKGAVRRLMDSTYLAKVAAERAKKKGLDKTDVIQARFWIHEINVLAVADMAEILSKEEMGLEAAVKEYFVLHKKEFRKPDMISASHILLKAKKPEELEQAKKKLEHIKALIDSGELTFEDAARKYSEDSSAGKGGLLGDFGPGQMVLPFEKAAYALEKEGQISDPVKTRFGYHLIRLNKKIMSRPMTFEEVKPRILAKLREEKKKQVREDYLIAIRDDPAIKLNMPAIEKFLAKPTLK